MKPLTAGRVARRLLAFYNNDPKKWTKHQYHDDDKTCFCVIGALRDILKVDARDYERWRRYYEATQVLRPALGYLAVFNDSCKDFQEFKTKLHEIARMP